VKILKFAAIGLLVLGCRVASSGETEADVESLNQGKVALPGNSFPVPDGEGNSMTDADKKKVLQAMNDLAEFSGEELYDVANNRKAVVHTADRAQFEACLDATGPAPWSELGATFYCLLAIEFRYCFTGAVRGDPNIGFTTKYPYRQAYDHCAGNRELKGEPLFGAYSVLKKKVRNFEPVFNNLLFHTECTYSEKQQKEIIEYFYANSPYMAKIGPYTAQTIHHRAPRTQHLWESSCPVGGGTGGQAGNAGGTILHDNCPIVEQRDPKTSKISYAKRQDTTVTKYGKTFTISDCLLCGDNKPYDACLKIMN
jgi:hypothetical protein